MHIDHVFANASRYSERNALSYTIPSPSTRYGVTSLMLERSIYIRIHLLFNSFPFPEELNFNNYKLVSRKKSL